MDPLCSRLGILQCAQMRSSFFTERLPDGTKSWLEFVQMTMTFQNSLFPFQAIILGTSSEMAYETSDSLPSYLPSCLCDHER